jgi:hypothetical protein
MEPESLTLFRTLGDPYGMDACLQALGVLTGTVLGRPAEGYQLLAESLQSLEAIIAEILATP